MLVRLMVGGNNPDLRLSLMGKLMYGVASKGTPLKYTAPPLARPTSSSLSSSRRDALTHQSGMKPGGALQVL